jgi:sialidase-1
MAKPVTSPQIVTVAAATAEHPRHSEPAVIERRDGSLFMVWQEYLASGLGGNDHAPSRLAAMTSADSGLTWGGHRVLVKSAPGDVNVYSPNLLKLGNGDWLFIYFRYHVLAAGRSPSTSAFACRSADEGQTFGPPRAIWARQPLGFASGVVKRLATGRLVLPVGRQTGAVWSAWDLETAGCLLSDDAGATWRESANWVDLPLRGAMEAHVEELRDRRLLMVMRTQLGAVFQAHSADGGLTWTKAQTTGLRAPESCPELVRVPRTGDLLIAWNNSEYDPCFGSHYGKRSPLTVALSKDDGLSWTCLRDIETDPGRAFSNPVAFVTSREKVVLMYWTCPYFTERWRMNAERIDLRAAVFDLDWICHDI